MARLKVLFKKQTEIWIDSDNNILCGNLCRHLNIERPGFGIAKCELFNVDRYGHYIGTELIGINRCEDCFKLETRDENGLLTQSDDIDSLISEKIIKEIEPYYSRVMKDPETEIISITIQYGAKGRVHDHLIVFKKK